MEANMTHKNANVIARPPLIFLAFVVAGLMINALSPMTIFHQTTAWIKYLGILLVIDGLVLIVWAWCQFRMADTPLDTSASVKHIVTRGIYRLTRNPIYLGMIIVYLGVALRMNNAWLLIGLIILLPTIYVGVILREERYLENRFQDEYRDYRNRVRRWM